MKTILTLAFLLTLTLIKSFGKDYNFLVAGHLYGSYESNNPIYPAKSLVSNTEFIKSFKSNFFISLGDNCANGNDSASLKYFDEAFVNRINMPLYTAFGNHDGDRINIEKRIKHKTYFSFKNKSELFIFLDSELDNQTLNKECLDFFLTSLFIAKKNKEIKNVFILSHKLIWSISNSKFATITDNSNDPKYKYQRYQKFYQSAHPLIKEISKEKELFWISGDIGMPWSLPIFYNQNKNMHFIATGLGDSLNDAILKFEISNSKVRLSALNLITHQAIDYRKYNLGYWEKSFPKHLVISRRAEKVFNKYFFLGLFSGFFLTCILIYIGYWFKLIIGSTGGIGRIGQVR